MGIRGRRTSLRPTPPLRPDGEAVTTGKVTEQMLPRLMPPEPDALCSRPDRLRGPNHAETGSHSDEQTVPRSWRLVYQSQARARDSGKDLWEPITTTPERPFLTMASAGPESPNWRPGRERERSLDILPCWPFTLYHSVGNRASLTDIRRTESHSGVPRVAIGSQIGSQLFLMGGAERRNVQEFLGILEPAIRLELMTC